MQGTVSIRRSRTRAALLWQALLIVSALSQLACDGTVVRPNPVTPTPTTDWETLGYYTVTMTAAPSCSLPDYAMKGSYGGALLRQAGQDLVALFDPYGPFMGSPGFTGKIDGQSVRFTLNGDQGASGYSFIPLVNGVEVAYTGTAVGTMGAGGIVATFNGTVRLSLQSDHTLFATCIASDHKMEFVRQ